MKIWIAAATFAAILLAGCDRPTENSSITAAMPGDPNAAMPPPALPEPAQSPPAGASPQAATQ